MVGLILQGLRMGFLPLDFKVSRMFLEWVCRAEVLVSPSRLQGLKKISAYMKSSRYISTPIFSKMAHWSNK